MHLGAGEIVVPVDVTRRGRLHETLGIAIADTIFAGDALFPGGNDYPAEHAGAEFDQSARPA